jgi:hypothetical protein
MIRIHLDDATRDELQAMRQKALPLKVRDRIEMVTLSDAGWSAPRIATHLGYCGQTVRGLLRVSLERRTEALHPRRTGPSPDAARRDRVAEELRRSLAEARTWTSRQLSEALAGRGIVLGPREVRRHQNRMKAEDSTLEAFGESFREIVNKSIEDTLALAAGNPALAFAIASTAEARFRAMNHYSVATGILAKQQEEQQGMAPANG